MTSSFIQPPLYGSLPCYTQVTPDRWMGQYYGETKIVSPKPFFNIADNIEFDTNYGPRYAIPVLPLSDLNDFSAPMAHRMPSDYVKAPHDVITPATLRGVDERFRRVAHWKQ